MWTVGNSQIPVVREREHWLPPAELIDTLGLEAGMVVADLGAGSGYYAVPIGKCVGARGRVYAIEPRPALVEELRAGAHAPGVPMNIVPLESSAQKTNLPDKSCDVVLAADVLHELEDREGMLEEAKRLLREGGHLAILEWREDATPPPGPAVQKRLAFKDAVCLVEQNSWSIDKAREVGPDGYVLILEPTDESVQS